MSTGEVTNETPDYNDGISHSEFGLLEAFKCGARVFFEEMRHPCAGNCECPKFSDKTCVPRRHWPEYESAITEFRRAAHLEASQ